MGKKPLDYGGVRISEGGVYLGVEGLSPALFALGRWDGGWEKDLSSDNGTSSFGRITSWVGRSGVETQQWRA